MVLDVITALTGGLLLVRPQLQEGQELGQVDEPFGFPPLLGGQLLPSVLAVEQYVKAVVDALREPETFQVLRELKLDENLLRHARPRRQVSQLAP